MKILVIGGVAAGTKTAAKLKREDRTLDVILLTKDRDISYAGCGLPYYVGGLIESSDALVVNTPEKYAALTGVTVHTGREAVELDSAAKTVKAKNLLTGETETYAYDRLVLAVGASPVIPPIEGVELKGVFKMRTPEDAVRIRAYIEAEQVKKAVVIGGSFIGLEAADNLRAQGAEVTVLDLASQLLPNVLDAEMADYVRRHLQKQGVRVMTGVGAEKLLGDGRVTAVQAGGSTLPAELVVLSAGIRPNTAFLASSGIELYKGAILVDECLRTSLPDVYAAGDCVIVTNRLTGRRQWSPMGSSANLEGRTLAAGPRRTGQDLPRRAGYRRRQTPGPELRPHRPDRAAGQGSGIRRRHGVGGHGRQGALLPGRVVLCHQAHRRPADPQTAGDTGVRRGRGGQAGGHRRHGHPVGRRLGGP